MLALLALLNDEADRALFLEFHARYEQKLYLVAFKILKSVALAEDAVQDAMLQIVLHFEDIRRYSLPFYNCR